MKHILTIITLFQLLLFKNNYAQTKKVVFINKQNLIEEVFYLPRSTQISLIDDNPNFFSKAILDSVNNDTFYISNPENTNQSLAIPFNIIHQIKVTKKYHSRGLVVFFSIFLSGVSISRANPNISLLAFTLGVMGYGIASKVERSYNIFQFEVKSTNK